MATTVETTFRERLTRQPGPATKWLGVLLVLVALQFGAVMQTIMSTVPWGTIGGALPATAPWAALAGVGDALADLPTLLARDVIPNQGYQVPGEGWQGTFMGLSPAAAWGIRVSLVYLYSFGFVGWLGYGYLVFRRHYRAADWTPYDDMLGRLDGHRWGQFGLVVVLMFIVMALFAPTLGPTTVQSNIAEPFSHELQYFDENAGEVTTILVGEANLQSVSKGGGGRNVGPMQYDRYDRFHPFGTLPSGKDLFTFMVAGARVSLFIGLLYISLAAGLAVVLALVTAYYKGLADLTVVIAGDSVQALPQLLVLILLSFVLSDTWIAGIYNGGLLLALIFAITGWPYLWRAVRGPALQVSNEEWIDAAKSFGQRPVTTMRKHMLPYVVGYLLIYASLSLGGAIIGVAGLSFLGLGVNPPTPEWGRAVSAGQPYVATASWHISLIPGIMVVIIVTAFNALGDGIRDAVDPQSEAGSNEVAAGGGGA
ncbi:MULTISPECIES: ABC transporter permease [Halolamina]|uniref:Peptide/nickel transport system permease protein n=1 Tax=Halolamina pelagica TaxID=699431 RepID=A0A1I5VX73_9EURY|nr:MULTISPECIES: ABC transporter permease [Halolamina]NHX37529.1 ABC transporter permease [Halolamina sp. R1-12]SFQ11897.1 peptide/nickel transport system permease protein [Halolamina pelagica]